MRSARRAVPLAIVALAAGACGGPQTPGSAGDTCYRAADCALGLVCIENSCSNDLKRIVSQARGPAARNNPAAARDASGDGQPPVGDGAAGPTGTDAAQVDAAPGAADATSG